MKRIHPLLIALGIVALANAGLSQESAAWRFYGAGEGLPENGCRYVSVGGGGVVYAQDLSSTSAAFFNGYSWTNLAGLLPGDIFGRISESPAGQLWIIGATGLYQYSDGKWSLNAIPEIAVRHRQAANAEIPLCAVRQNVVLILLPDALLEFASDATTGPGLRVIRSADQTGLGRFTGMRIGADDGLWICGEHGLAKIAGPSRAITEQAPWREFLCPESLGAGELRQLRCADDDSVTCVGDAKSGSGKLIVRFDGERWSVLPVDAPIRCAWQGPDGALWAATSKTLLRIENGKPVASEDLPPCTIFDVAVGAHGMFWVATSEGLFCRTPLLWRAESNTPPGLFASKPVELIAQNGDHWSVGPEGLIWVHQQTRKTFTTSDLAAPHDAVALLEMPDGKIWCATPEKIWMFDGGNWTRLRGGFGRINDMIRTADGSVWVASNDGAHRFIHGTWIDLGVEEGLSGGAARKIGEDSAGRVWTETLRGVEVYCPEADSDPPGAFIQMPSGRERRVPEGASVTVSFGGRDKWNVTPPARLLFSWRLDDHDWSPFDAATSAPFIDLPSGQHYFQVRAMDRNGNIDPHPARLEFAVVLPWYRESRSRWIAATGAAAALFFAGLALKRHRDLRHSYAQVERQVAERTAELKLANQELLQSQKMTALGTLAAGIAHDFNNILSIIKGSAQIIEQNIDNPQKIRARAERIKTVVDQGSAVVQALLGFSRNSDESNELSEINAVVDNTIRLLGDRFLRETEVRFDRGGPLPTVRTSTGLIQQILLNFIFNAAEAMSERKEVIVATGESSRLPSGVALSPTRAASYVLVSVRDRGGGIAPEILPRIFEPFFTTKAMSARRGTGLGLSVAYELARKMGAGLAVESWLGQGSVFTLILPAAGVSTPAAALREST